MFNLNDLLDSNAITLQCHDNPDPDAIASAFALYSWLKSRGKQARIVYCGREITKPNILKMLELLSIPIENAPPGRAETLVTVDCQYGEANVTPMEADRVYIIDHHRGGQSGHPGIIRSELGSCATVVWDLLRKADFSFSRETATALYYGLYADTGAFEEIWHPLDKDMRDSLLFDKGIFNTLRHNNLTLAELDIAGAALKRRKINKAHRFAFFRAEPCDSNILGFVSDLALQVEDVETCVVYAPVDGGFKLSVRSCTKTVAADEFAAFLASGGGHRQKAGGFIPHMEKADEYLEAKALAYFAQWDIIDASGHNPDVGEMALYKKIRIPVGYAKCVSIFPEGTPLCVRSLEGDAEITAAADMYLMVGIQGEAYPIEAEKFNKTYEAADIPFDTDHFSYAPTVINRITGEAKSLIPHTNSCLPTDSAAIYAKPLDKHTKVFTRWNTEGYMSGKPGDYLVVRADNYNDIYIVKKDIFEITYAENTHRTIH